MRRGQRTTSPFLVGLGVLLVAAIGVYFGFTKSNPLADPFEMKAAFRDAAGLKKKSPVRVAGITIGEVTKVDRPDPGSPGVVVTMKIDERGLPVHRDARLKVRPRIFLEGNVFVDMTPGSPTAPTLGDGDTIPLTQTAAPVGLGKVLESLQSNTREDLQTVLQEYGSALEGEGARGFNRSIQYWEPAYRDGAVVADATRGLLIHDLSNYIDRSGVVAQALDRDPVALKGLISNFSTVAAAFQSEQGNLRRAVNVLDDTLETGFRALGELNTALPPLRRLARDLRPAVRSAGPSLDAQLPLVKELRGLLRGAELGGLAKDLRAVVPDLVELNEGGVPLQEQTRLLSSCQVNVIQPTANSQIDDPNFPTTGKVFQEGVKWLPGIAGESRGFDANGQYIKTTAKGGANFAYSLGAGRFLLTSAPLGGVNPPARSVHPPMRPDVPCETQEAPDVQSTPQAAPAGRRIRTGSEAYARRNTKATDAALTWLRGQLKAEGLDKKLRVLDTPITKAAADRIGAAARAERAAQARAIRKAGK